MNNIPYFTGRNVPVEEIAKALNVPEEIIILGIEYDTLKFGKEIKLNGTKYFICPDKKVWEETGYFKSDTCTDFINDKELFDNHF